MGTQQSRIEGPTSSDATPGAGEQPDHKGKPGGISPTSSMNASTSSISLVTYQTGKTLSSGTHAIVKEAIHVRTGKHYACKIFNKKLMEHREHMIRNEIAILRRISGGHCNVVTLHDHFETASNLYLVFDLCTGGQLFERVCARGNYDETEAANLVRNTFKAVKYIHDSGVVHRKSHFPNTAEDADIMITNFSLSKELDEEDPTMLTEVCGTTSFMAPEIFNGTGYGKAVDVWAMGVISYFLLAGYAPFNHGSEQEEVKAIITGDYNFEPQEYWATFAETARDFIRTCLKNAQQPLKPYNTSAHFVPGPDNGPLVSRTKKVFNAKQAWRKVAFSIIAVKRMSTLADQQRDAIQELRANLDKYREKSAEELKESVTLLLSQNNAFRRRPAPLRSFSGNSGPDSSENASPPSIALRSRFKPEFTLAPDSDIESLSGQDTPAERHRQTSVDQRLRATLSDVLTKSHKRKALEGLKGDCAQVIADFLDSIILQPDLANPWLRKHSLIVLYKLSKSSNVYPQCYVLKDIKRGTPEDGGGFCDIYKGLYSDQHVCLKVVRLYQKPDTDAMLKVVAKETILWRQLRHLNILPFYGIYYLDESRRQICLVSPWMDNGNLVVYLKKNPFVPRKPFICDIAHGLGYLHREDIIHGDLKGVNILVNASGRACVADFGLSSVRTDKTFPYTSATTTVSGCTYRWLAPELLETNSRRTRASDVWAFGSVCYGVFTQELPYRECSGDYQVVMKVHAGELPALPEGDAVPEWDRVDDEAWGLMDRCWAREPENRPTFIQILRELQAGAYDEKQEEVPDRTSLESQHGFQKAMQRNSDIRIDLVRVEQILSEL